jgi:membrane protease YdiL (CAAX protease family)
MNMAEGDELTPILPAGEPSADPSMPAWPPHSVPYARPISEFAGFRPWRWHPFLLPQLSRAAAWADIGMAAVLLLALDMLTGLALSTWLYSTGATPVDGEWTRQMQQRVLVPGLILRAASAAVVIGAILLLRRQPLEAVGLPRRGWILDTAIGFAAVIVAYGAVAITVLIVWLAWPQLIQQLTENAERLKDLVPPLAPSAFLPLALLIGVYEEVVFRGFFMARLRRATGSWVWAVLATTVVFTGLHAIDQTPAALIIVSVLSIVFSLLTIWRRSIVPAIVAHALFDWSQFILLSNAMQNQ